MLESNRIKLRAIEESDLPLMASWRNNPKVYEYFIEYLPVSLRQQRNWYEKQLTNTTEINFIIENKKDNTAIGTSSILNIDTRNRKAEWSRVLIADPKFRNNGIGVELECLMLQYCFEHLNLHKLWCQVIAINPQVISMHKKFGFREEGVLKRHVFKAGQYLDIVLLAMFNEEYFTQKTKGLIASIFSRISNKNQK